MVWITRMIVWSQVIRGGVLQPSEVVAYIVEMNSAMQSLHVQLDKEWY